MTFSKLLLQSLFDNVPDLPKKQTENCYQPCLKYKTPPCYSEPKYLPQQFPPYYDNIDPNSIRKYREWPTRCLQPTCIEPFKVDEEPNIFILVVILFAILVLVCTILK